MAYNDFTEIRVIENPRHGQRKTYRAITCSPKPWRIEASLKDTHYDVWEEANGNTALPRIVHPMEHDDDSYVIEEAIEAKNQFFNLLKQNGFDSIGSMADAVRNGFVSIEELEEIVSYQFFEDLFPEKLVNAIYDNLASEGYVMPDLLVKNKVSVISGSNGNSVSVEQGSYEPMARKLLHRNERRSRKYVKRMK